MRRSAAHVRTLLAETILSLLNRRGLIKPPTIRASLEGLDRESLFYSLRPFTKFLSGEDGELVFLVPSADDVVARHVFISGNFDRHTLERASSLLPRWHRRTRFIDVGANIGTSAVTALRCERFQRAECFEPRVDLLPILRANLALNEVDSVTEVHGLALSSSPGVLDFEIGQTNFGDNRIRQGLLGPRAAGSTQSSKVPAVTGASALGPLEPKDDFIWMDVQGHEVEALSGMDFSRGVPYACIEIDPGLLSPRWDGDTIAVRLHDLGYEKFVRLNPSAPERARLSVSYELPQVFRQLQSSDGWDDLLLIPAGAP